MLHARLFIMLSLVTVGTSADVWGNAGPSDTPATIVGEPAGIIDVDIFHETLTIDLRPLATGDPAQVEAIYELENAGPAKELRLLFAFGSPNRDNWKVTLDGAPISGTLQQGASMPEEWWPPKTTPPLPGDDQPLIYAGGWRTVVPLAFQVSLPAGKSELRVQYEEYGKTTFARPAMYRQFAYILAPARAWSSFGGMDVAVHTPDDWLVAAAPDLTCDGSVLRGRFDSVPADSIGITLRPPIPAGYVNVQRARRPVMIVIAVVGLAFCWWLGGVATRRAARARTAASPSEDRFTARSYALLIGLLYALALLATGLFFMVGIDMIFPPDAAEREMIRKLRLSGGYGQIFSVIAVIFMSLVAMIVGFVTALTASVKRHASTKQPRASVDDGNLDTVRPLR